MADRRRQTPDDGLTDAELDAIFAALAQQPEPATLTGRENAPPPPLPDNLGADYERPESGGSNPLDVLAAMPPEQLAALGTPEGEAAATAEAAYRRDPLQGAGARPQTPDEAQALDEDQRSAANMVTAATLAVPTGRAAAAVTRAAAPAVRTIANVAGRNPAVTVPATAITAATAVPGETQTPDPTQATRDQIAKLRQRETELETENTRLTAEGRRFNTLKRDDKDAVQRAQEALQSQGLYLRNTKGAAVKPDGVWGDGMAKAIEEYQARIRADLEKNRQDRLTLGKDLEKQTGRLTGLEGDERLRAADRNSTGFQRFLREYGEPAATVAGIGAGAGFRIGLIRGANKVAEMRARAVEALLARRMTNIPDRSGRLSEVWRRGGQAGGEPFVAAPGTQYGLQPNPNAVPASQLFRPPRFGGYVSGADLGGVVVGGGDIAYSEHQLGRARRELAEAQDAARREPTELNISRMQAAIDDAAFWQATSRFGQGMLIGYGGAATKTHRRGATPDLQRADSETAKLNQLIAPRPPSPPPSPAPRPTGEQLRYPAGTIIDGRNVGGRFKPRGSDD